MSTTPKKGAVDWANDNARRLVGIAVLRKLRKFVDEHEQARRLERWALTVLCLFGLGLVALVAGHYWIKPEAQVDSSAMRYAIAWKQVVENHAALNPPASIRSERMTGAVVLSTSIKADGTIEKLLIVTSSGQEAFDNAALHLVRSAGPFQPFSEEMKRDTDIVTVTHGLRFDQGAFR